MSVLPLVDSFIPASDSSLRPMTVVNLLLDAAKQHPDRIAIKQPGVTGRRYTYAELLSQSMRAGTALLHCFAPGDRVGVWAPNQIDWIFLQMGSAFAGLTLVTMNPANRLEEISYLLKQSNVKGLFMERSFRDQDNAAIINSLSSELTNLEQVHLLEDWQEFVDSRQDDRRPLPLPTPTDPALVVYTSGTTGKPKGVVLTHSGIVNNAWFSTQRYELKPGSVWLNTLPMFHVGGSVTMTLGCICNIGTQVVLPGFDPELMLRSLEQDKVTMTMAVPTMLNALFEHPNFDRTDFSCLELMVTGATTIPPETITKTQSKMNVDVQVIFGQTEAGGVMAQTRRGDSIAHLCDSVGIPLAPNSMKVISSETQKILPVNTIGEICVRSHFSMKEYLDMPDKTAEAIDSEGWIHTGDLGKITDDGYVQISGRLKDMVISGGENIYPREIEDKLIQHKSIAEVAVFGVPDSKWGEKLVAAVRLAKDGQFDPDDFIAFLDQRIARYKIPREWIEVSSLPTNASGKIQKFLLAKQFIEQS